MSPLQTTMSHNELDSLKIFTLNCWGLRYFSQHRKLRIKLIAQHLAEHDYDIVFLQEVWIQSDFEYIRTKTKSIYTFAHMFNNASILGTSGLVIMAKWIPKMIHFHPFSINGSPFRITHGDWFSTKGVAYARIDLKGFNLHLFCTHMHAQYDEEEDITDQYSIHRVCQSYELAKYINLMACNCANPSSKDLIILAGDMNTSSKELPYRLLVEMTGLVDCYKKFDQKKKNYRRKELTLNGQVKKSHINRLHHCSDESSDEELITCGHKDNTFTKPTPNSKPIPKSSKRIDFILYKLRDFRSNENNCEFSTRLETSSFVSCFPEQMKITAKDVSGLSYSDHQPVAAKLNFINHMNTFEESEEEDGRNPSSVESNDATDGEIKSKNIHETKCDQKSKKLSKCKPSAKDDNAKWKQLTSSMLSHQLQHFSSIQPTYSKLNSSFLHDIEALLADYIQANTPFRHVLFVALVMFVMSLMLVVEYFLDMSIVVMILSSIIFLILSFVGFVLGFVLHRHEVNAIKAILSDISKKRTFTTDYGLLESE